MKPDNVERLADLTFEDFKRLALDDSLSSYEKVGFPNSYREGKEPFIFQDIVAKVKNIANCEQLVLDIGPGCSGLAFMLIELCRRNGHTLILVDSPEMLSRLPDDAHIIKVPGRYPHDCGSLFKDYEQQVNVILTYSVLHYVFVESSIFEFVDRSLSLLADGGEMLIGDIPNVSMRKRFFSSLNGVRFHQNYTETDEIPHVEFKTIEAGKIDDSVILSLLMRCRAAGFNAFCLPQPSELPMANRREDILIRKP